LLFIDSFSSKELPTLDRNIIQAKFTIAELKAIDSEFMKRGLASIDFYKALPFSLVCANPSTPWLDLFKSFKVVGLTALFLKIGFLRFLLL